VTRRTPLVLALIACTTCVHRSRGTEPGPVPSRPDGQRRYEFTSSQDTPAGRHRVRLRFTLTTRSPDDETADVISYENANDAAALAAGVIDSSCAAALRPAPGVIARFHVSPPPQDLSHVVAACAPEDMWGAISDILPFFMLQTQPRFRARELTSAGERLRSAGYDIRWKIPPTLLDQRIVADSGVVRLDSLTSNAVVLDWNTSPMDVRLVRRLPTGQNALLAGREWFEAIVRIDRRSGELLDARTRADSLQLRMRVGYPSDTVPVGAAEGTGPLVRVVRQLELRLLN
jgi:hypothetical protein